MFAALATNRITVLGVGPARDRLWGVGGIDVGHIDDRTGGYHNHLGDDHDVGHDDHDHNHHHIDDNDNASDHHIQPSHHDDPPRDHDCAGGPIATDLESR